MTDSADARGSREPVSRKKRLKKNAPAELRCRGLHIGLESSARGRRAAKLGPPGSGHQTRADRRTRATRLLSLKHTHSLPRVHPPEEGPRLTRGSPAARPPSEPSGGQGNAPRKTSGRQLPPVRALVPFCAARVASALPYPAVTLGLVPSPGTHARA